MKRIYLAVVALISALGLKLHDSLFGYMSNNGLILHVSTNTLTNLIPTIYAAADIVSRELVGFIPAVTRDSKIDRVAINQTVNVPVVGAITPVAITPANVSPDTGGMAPGNVTVTISNQYQAPIAWNGDEQIVVGETGLYDSVMAQRFAQGMRAITNLVEADLAALHVHASRAVGTYNVQPFNTASDLTSMANAIQVLEDNGAPGDLHAVLGSGAIANLRGKQSVLFKVNESGTSDLLRRGIIGDIFGVQLHNSAAVKRAVTAGTMASATTLASTALTVGQTALVLATAGTGVAVAGDLITLANDTNVYVVESVTFAGANPAANDVITLAEPGLRVAQSTAARAITVTAATDRNMVFSRSAIVLATRSPYMPAGGDQASDVIEIVDPVSGLAYQVAMYRQYRQIHFEIGLAWGVKMLAARHSAILMG